MIGIQIMVDGEDEGVEKFLADIEKLVEAGTKDGLEIRYAS